MSIKHETDYYVASNEYEFLPAMSKVRMHGYDDHMSEVYVVQRGDDEDWLWSGYVKVQDLLTADQIIKLRDHDLMMADAFERHG